MNFHVRVMLSQISQYLHMPIGHPPHMSLTPGADCGRITGKPERTEFGKYGRGVEFVSHATCYAERST
jgi:hypothetical protein